MKDRETKKKELASILSASERTVRDWLSRIDKDTKEKQRRQAFDLWLACHAQEAIAAELSWSQQSVADFQKTFTGNGNIAVSGKSDDSEDDGFKLTKAQLASADHATDFDTPIYNIWKQQEKTKGSNHFGNSEVRWARKHLQSGRHPRGRDPRTHSRKLSGAVWPTSARARRGRGQRCDPVRSSGRHPRGRDTAFHRNCG